jgi:hypothetical protein
MCLHAKHVFSNQFGWYVSFNCIITEKCVYFDHDPVTLAYDVTRDVGDTWRYT